MRLAEAAAELLRTCSVRGSLIEWAKHKGFEPGAHRRLIIREIESFLASYENVLELFAPPGSARSTYVSRLLPLGISPTTRRRVRTRPTGAAPHGKSLPRSKYDRRLCQEIKVIRRCRSGRHHNLLPRERERHAMPLAYMTGNCAIIRCFVARPGKFPRRCVRVVA